MAKVINTHMHLGQSYLTDTILTEEMVLQNMEENGIDGAMVYPIVEPKPDNKTAHDMIYEFAKRNPGKIWGVVDMHPRHPEEEYRAEVKRCIEELGFVAIKYHPLLQAMNPDSSVSDKVFRIANELKVPLIVHTGNGIPYALPSRMIPKAMQYPDLKIVLAHAGTYMFSSEAMIAAELCPNIYLEPSWCEVHHIQQMISRFGSKRVMMGSDIPVNTAIEVAKARALKISEEDRANYMGETAIEFYGLK